MQQVFGILIGAVAVVLSLALFMFWRWGDNRFRKEPHRKITFVVALTVIGMILPTPVLLGTAAALSFSHSAWVIALLFGALGLFPISVVFVVTYSQAPGGLGAYWISLWYQITDPASWGPHSYPQGRREKTIKAHERREQLLRARHQGNG